MYTCSDNTSLIPDATVMFYSWLHSTRTPAQTRVRSHFLNRRTSSWQRRSSSTTSTETSDSSDETWQVRDVTAAAFICSISFSLKHPSSIFAADPLPPPIWCLTVAHIPLIRQTVSPGIRVDGETGRVSSRSLCCVFYVWKPQPACETLSLWFFLRFPQNKPRPGLASFFLTHTHTHTHTPSNSSAPWFPIPGPTSHSVTVYTYGWRPASLTRLELAEAPEQKISSRLFLPVLLSKCAHMTPFSMAVGQTRRVTSRTMLTLTCARLWASCIVVSRCIHVFLPMFHCACTQRLGVLLLILAWRLSDLASNPPAHQISCLCAPVAGAGRPWLPTYVISRPGVSAAYQHGPLQRCTDP